MAATGLVPGPWQRWWSATDGRHVGYESWLERDEVMWLDWDRAVTAIASQPFRLWWTAGEGKAPSLPDYFAERGDGPAVVVDCRLVVVGSRALLP